MPQRSGTTSIRSDCENMALCGERSLYHCRMYCRKDIGRSKTLKCKYIKGVKNG